MSCLGCSSSEEPICARCAAILREQEKTVSKEFDDFTPRELAYVLVLQGIMSSGNVLYSDPNGTVLAAMQYTDILFEKIQERRKNQ